MSRRAVLLDRDDTLVHNVPYLADPDGLELFTDVAALRRLTDAGYRLAVVTNQAGVARGLVTVDQLEAVTARLRSLLAEQGVEVSGVWWCPHHPDFTGPCRCRKPAPGMLLDALESLDADPAQSWMIGDNVTDVGAGVAAGVRTVLVDHHERRDRRTVPDVEVAVVTSLVDAVDTILGADG